MKKILLAFSMVFAITANGQNCTPTHTVTPVLCADPINNIYIVDSSADVQISITDGSGVKQNVIWSPSEFLYINPNQTNPYPSGGIQVTDIYFNGALSNRVYTYTASYQISGCTAVTENFTLVTSGFTYDDFCFGDSKTLADISLLNIPNGNLGWYSDATGTTSLPTTTPIQPGTTYYVDLGLAGCSTIFPVDVKYSTPPLGDPTQEFCTTATWTNAGLGYTGGMVGDLNVSGQNLSWYFDAAATMPIANPATETLVNGTTYYVSQTINGCESGLLGITVNERQFPCIKNPGFEDTALGTYDFYDINTSPSYNGCGIDPSIVNNSVAPGPLDSTSDDSAAPVSYVFDPMLQSFGVNLPQTSSLTTFSDYAVRLNSYNDVVNGSANSGKVSKMETSFIAGEVFVFDFSFVLREPMAHSFMDEPFFKVMVSDQNGNLVDERCVYFDNFFQDVAQQNGSGDPDPSHTLVYTEWSCLKMNTSSIQGQPATVRFLVADCALNLTAHAGYAYIDNIFVGKLADVSCNDYTCSRPTNLSLTNTTNQSADFSWGFAPNAIGYEWSVFTSGDNPSTATPVKTGNTMGVTATSVTVTGLNPLTNYDFYVSSVCGTNYPTTMTGPLAFGTFPKPSNINVGNSTSTSVDVSWTENGAATEWELRYGPIGFDHTNSGTTVTDADGVPSETLTNLTPDTDYDLYIRSVYGAPRSTNTPGASEWAGPFAFNTSLNINETVFERFHFSPNPVKEKLSLNAQKNIQKIVLYDLLGKKVGETTPYSLDTVLDLSGLGKGIYFMKVTIDGSTGVYRIIKE